MKFSLFLSSIVILMFFSCKAQQYTLDSLPEKQLIFGSGGGITGEVNTYIMLENGQVFYSNSLVDEHKELKSITKKEALGAFEKTSALQLSEIDFNHPGNMYYFIEEVNGEEKNRVTWGSTSHEVDEKCEALYKELRMTIK